MEVNVGVIEAAIGHMGGEAEYGLEKLRRLDSEGRGTEFLAEARAVLEAIRTTVMFDVKNEYHTLLGKLGIAPVYDPDAQGPPSVNVGFILRWLGDDLVQLNQLIRKVRGSGAAGSTLRPDADRDLLELLLEAVGTEMLRSYSLLGEALEQLQQRRGGVS